MVKKKKKTLNIFQTAFEGGDILLTSHRLLWTSPNDTTFCLSLSLKYVVFLEEEIPGAFSFTRSSKIVLHLSSPSPGNLWNSYIEIW